MSETGARLPILGASAEQLPERFLVVGDPARAKQAEQLLSFTETLSQNREYCLYAGSHRGQRVGVASHGVGSAGAAICFEELFRGGVQCIVRAGTAGSLSNDLSSGQLAVVTGAVRDDGASERLVALRYPAFSDPDLVLALRRAAHAHRTPAAEGITLTTDVFYPSDVLGPPLEIWQRSGVQTVEMECATLFVIAQLHQRRAGAILAIDGSPLEQDDGSMETYDPKRPEVDDAVASMLDIALDALIDDREGL